VVRRDFELTGFVPTSSRTTRRRPVCTASKTRFDVDAWRKLGAEAIVKVAARKAGNDQIEVSVGVPDERGKSPCSKEVSRQKTDARSPRIASPTRLLGALTGRPGGFASELAFSGRWAKTAHFSGWTADGNGLLPFTDAKDTAIAPAFGPSNRSSIWSATNTRRLRCQLREQKNEVVAVPFKTSLYGVSLSRDGSRWRCGCGRGQSAIFVGGATAPT